MKRHDTLCKPFLLFAGSGADEQGQAAGDRAGRDHGASLPHHPSAGGEGEVPHRRRGRGQRPQQACPGKLIYQQV